MDRLNIVEKCPSSFMVSLAMDIARRGRSVSCGALALYMASIAGAAAADITVIEKSWYVGAYGGGGLTDISKSYHIRSVRSGSIVVPADDKGSRSYDMSPAFLAGAVIGTEVSDNIRIELDVSYSWQDLDGATDRGRDAAGRYRDRFDDVSGDLHAVYLFGNLWFDLPTGYGVSPYIGGGPGVAFVNGDGSGSHHVTGARWNELLDVSETAFAYQLGAGVRWEVADMVNIDAGYRWRHALLNETGDLTSHNFILGASLGF